MKIPFAKTIASSFIQGGLDWLKGWFENAKKNTDLDEDGIKDFDEVPIHAATLHQAALEAMESVDGAKLASGIEKVTAGIKELSDCLKVEEAKAAFEKGKAAALELFKLAMLAIAKVTPKEVEQ
ncbi:MAG: hypothetical protein K2W95_00780 [Candidatus Obscuribacterales bacterium]|nr:hypothetical protein [Candidatus Obscuribacterales bacterium]